VLLHFLTASGFKVNVLSTSTKTGTAPTLKTASKLATNVKQAILLHLRAPIPKLLIAVVNAAVPLLVSCAYACNQKF
jgi:hypothetical protein